MTADDLAEAVLPPWAYRPLYRRYVRAVGEPELRLLPQLCARDGIAVDVGASLGYYTAWLEHLCGRCIAFEPNPQNAARLRRLYPRVEVRQVALSSTSGETVLRIPVHATGFELTGWSTIEPGNDLSAAEAVAQHEIAVETATLDSFNLSHVSFIKIDVEGHELSVLQGAQRTLAASRPNLLVEVQDRTRPGALPAVFGMLGRLGYQGHFVEGGCFVAVTDLDRDVREPVAKGIPHINFVFLPAQ
jgi:FkbM family methyltransferase